MKLLNLSSILALKAVKFTTVALASAMIVTSSYTLWDMHHTEKSAFSSYDLSQYRPQVENGDPANLDDVNDVNKDARAWLTIYNTNIDYPVMQGKDDLEYVNKDIYGKSTPTGSIYLASQNDKSFSDDYNLMYGHHMDNGAMFGDVEKFTDESFFNKHTKGLLVTNNGVYDLELIGSMETHAYDNIVYNPKRTGLNIVDYIKENGKLTRNINGIMKVLALSTCDYERTNGRDVAFFKMTEHEGPYEEYIPDVASPLAFHNADYWALLNLLCMFVTVYTFMPIHIFVSKYRRKSKMQERNELVSNSKQEIESPNECNNEIFKTDDRMYLVGICCEFIISIISVVTFTLTENMSLPIEMVDEWTPLMLMLLSMCLAIDVWLLRTGKLKETTMSTRQ